MPPLIKALLIITTFAVAALAALLLAGPSLQQRFFYPKPGPLPAAVTEPADVLLNRLQKMLDQHAPEIARHLQPGLSEAEIKAQEVAGGFTLPADIRALYRWRNGQAPHSPDGLLPGLRFLPLEIIVRERQLLAQQVRALGFWSRLNFRIFAGHRHTWVQIIDDGSGDGYYIDPARPEAEGAFFYNFSEVRHYTWFPSFRNFLTGLIECYDTGAVRVGPDRKLLEEDRQKTQAIWARLSRLSES